MRDRKCSLSRRMYQAWRSVSSSPFATYARSHPADPQRALLPQGSHHGRGIRQTVQRGHQRRVVASCTVSASTALAWVPPSGRTTSASRPRSKALRPGGPRPHRAGRSGSGRHAAGCSNRVACEGSVGAPTRPVCPRHQAEGATRRLELRDISESLSEEPDEFGMKGVPNTYLLSEIRLEGPAVDGHASVALDFIVGDVGVGYLCGMRCRQHRRGGGRALPRAHTTAWA